jgi:hypothetical protein
MATLRQLTALIAGTTSLISVPLLASFIPPQINSFNSSRDLGVLASVFANLPANAASNSGNDLLKNHQNFIIAQAARSRIRFVPPPNRNPRRSQGAGSRGCDESIPGNLVTLLIPSKDYVGQTVSGHPSFFWHVSKPVSVPMVFTLTKSGVPQPLYRQQIDSPQSGIIQIAIPKDHPELVPGQTYQWSVALVCYAKRPSSNPFFSSWIERVPTTPALEQQLAAVTAKGNSSGRNLTSGNAASVGKASMEENHARALIYAQAGLWYSALDAIFKARMANPNDPSIQADFRSLMEQVGLTQVAKQ